MGIDITLERGKLTCLFEQILPANKVEKARKPWTVSIAESVNVKQNVTD